MLCIAKHENYSYLFEPPTAALGIILEPRVLRYFIEVAREQNITAAAERLHVTQPILSKQLMDLESELGKKLFIRGKRKTVLTDDGMFLYRRAQEIVDLTNKTESALKTTDKMFSKLYIASTYNLVHNAALMVKAGMGCALTIDKLVNTADTDSA